MSQQRTAILALIIAILCTTARGEGDRQIPGWGRSVDLDGTCEFLLEDGTLTITAPGPVNDLSAELHVMNAPRVVRDVDGDFITEVKVSGTFEPGEAGLLVRTPYNGAGLLLMADHQNYLRLERATLVSRGQRRPYTNFELRVGGRVQRFGRVDDYPLDEASPTWLRLERRGNTIYAAVSHEEGTWHYIGSKTAELPDRVLIGVATVNASTHPFSPQFEGFAVYVKQPVETAEQKTRVDDADTPVEAPR